MPQLVKGMYSFVAQRSSDLFGLVYGQTRRGPTKMTHNSGWYNKAGEKLGYGDLSAEDFQRIQDGLEETELFIILSESDAHWNFVSKRMIKGFFPKKETFEDAPGIEYVAARALYIIGKGQLYRVRYFDEPQSALCHGWCHGLQFKVIRKNEVLDLISALPP